MKNSCSRPASLLLSLLVLSAQAPWVAAQQADETANSGTAREWVELQKSNSAASPAARPMPGEIADKTFQRYANSFSQPIPATLNREEFLSQGGGGGK